MTGSHFCFKDHTGETQSGSKPANEHSIELYRNYQLQMRHTVEK